MTWNSIYDTTFVQDGTDGRRRPFSTLNVEGVTGDRLAILATSSTARRSWWLAFELVALATINNWPVNAGRATAGFYRCRVPLSSNTLIELPFAPEQYNLRLEIPYWHQELRIQIWESMSQSERRQMVSASPGQNTFALPLEPEDPDLLDLFVNGVKATYGTEYAIDGTTLTWLSPLELDSSDEIEIRYP